MIGEAVLRMHAGRTFVALSVAVLFGCRISDRTADSSSRGATSTKTLTAAPFRVPLDSEVRDAELLRSVQRGRALLHSTRDSLPEHVGNALNCVSCHSGNGTVRGALPLIGVYARFPQYRSRSGRVDMLEDRVNDCFERSMNGAALARDGQDMRDLVAYMAFLSRGVPAGSPVEGQGLPPLVPLPGDTTRGAQQFAASCAVCHGADGLGTNAAPPVWGPQSFNVGAGMARYRTAAAFIYAAMPLNNPGSLTAQQAFDLAAYVTSRPRPDFARKADDWPKGDPPPDAAYPTRAAAAKGPR
jgi:thiosulfate dehydrogenase